jgi:hypothetical protein
MHGLVFRTLRDHLVASYGRETAATVFEGQPEYLLSEAYPDESLVRLIDVAAAHTGRDQGEIVFELGVFTGEVTFPRLYPAFYTASASTREFLLTVEGRIHELVRATIPQAGPPRLGIEPLGEDGVSIAYDSPRRLCVLLRGLAEGTARHYGERVELDERTCMLRGDAACTFEARLSAGSRS